MIKNIFRSLLITSVVSAIIATAFLSFGFAKVFAISFVAQFIIFYIINSVNQVKYKQAQAAALASMEKQVLEVTCPCFKAHKSYVPIALHEKNSYQCDLCNNLVSVNLEVSTCMSTVPVDIDQHQYDIKSKFDELKRKQQKEKNSI